MHAESGSDQKSAFCVVSKGEASKKIIPDLFTINYGYHKRKSVGQPICEALGTCAYKKSAD